MRSAPVNGPLNGTGAVRRVVARLPFDQLWPQAPLDQGDLLTSDQCALDENYDAYPERRPTFAEVALAAAEIEGVAVDPQRVVDAVDVLGDDAVVEDVVDLAAGLAPLEPESLARLVRAVASLRTDGMSDPAVVRWLTVVSPWVERRPIELAADRGALDALIEARRASQSPG